MNELKLLQICNRLNQISFTSHPLHSRAHLSNTIPNAESRCYIKRDDELSFGISGYKMRKYASLIPQLLEQNIQQVFVIGSAYSNNILSACQLLRENRLQPTLFLLGDGQCKQIGNHLLINLFIAPSDIQWVSRDQWHNVHNIAQKHADTLELEGKKTYILTEGASNIEALPGALTLALNIIKNEKQLKIEFQHILIDAGTGLMAAALILAFYFLQKDSTLHVLLLAQTPQEFKVVLTYWKREFEKLLSCSIEEPHNFMLHTPSCARSFGSVNATVLQAIKNIAQTEGILTDPIYSAKLFLEASKILPQSSSGSSLLIHSGGALTLAGFQTQLASVIEKAKS